MNNGFWIGVAMLVGMAAYDGEIRCALGDSCGGPAMVEAPALTDDLTYYEYYGVLVVAPKDLAEEVRVDVISCSGHIWSGVRVRDLVPVNRTCGTEP